MPHLLVLPKPAECFQNALGDKLLTTGSAKWEGIISAPLSELLVMMSELALPIGQGTELSVQNIRSKDGRES